MKSTLSRAARFGPLALAALLVTGCTTASETSTSTSTAATSAAETSAESSATSAGSSEGSATSEASTSEATGSAAAPTGDPIVIGHTAGMTGFMSVFDIPVEQGMQMAIDDINAAGGVLGRPLELVTNDNATDPTRIQTAAREIIEQGADFIVPSCDFDIGAPAAREALAANIVAIGCAGGPQFGYDGIGANTYNTHISSPAEGSVMATWAFEQGYTNPYVIVDDTLEYSQVAAESFITQWEALGGTIAGQDTFQSGDTSAASQVTGIQQAQPDLIVAGSYPPGGATLIQQIRSAGIETDMMGLQAFDGTYWLESIPNLSNFFIPATASMYGDDPRADINAFFERIETETGEPAASGFYPLSGYSSVQALATAIEEAGSTDTAAVEAALNSFTDEPLLIGSTTYTDTCHIPSARPQLVLEYTDGRPAVVAQDVVVTEVPGGNPC
ncbi:ABC transporter substrate-binding protein [Nakamurella sp. YIM 132087]|uniref:ABC transporter substrate-binding protein n=1 Tax=Nakamurella alba TaxID=2665158 RepID=A0A7K1FHL4_9ACTN|nr:ABC transporter substrate-binding protein [Nakamurella alba]MTD12773.1 ABC transporter substrate-binding protein [Nakamurella alba]